MMRQILIVLVIATICLAQSQLRGSQQQTEYNKFSQDHIYDDYSYLQIQYHTPPMDVMFMNHEQEIQRTMGIPGVITMNYVLEESPYNPAAW